MLCSLLRVIQLYVVSTALFSTSSTIYTDKAFRPVALTHSVVHPPTHTNQTVTVLYQPYYRSCFVKEEMNPPQLIFHASQGFDMKKMKIRSKNVNHTQVIRKPRSKPTKKPISQSVIKPNKPHDVAVHGGKPVSKPTVHPTSTVHSKPSVHPTTSSVHSHPVDHSKPSVHPTTSSVHSHPVDHSKPSVRPTTTVHSNPVDHSIPSSTPAIRPIPSVRPTISIREENHTSLRASSKNTAVSFDDQYVACVKAPQHLHGKVWDSAKELEISYDTSSSRIQQCASECKQEEFSYFAMESGTRCWCAHSQPDAEHLHDNMCAACADDSTHTCGNVNYGFMSIYKINQPAVVATEQPRTLKKVAHKKVAHKKVAHKKVSLLPKLNNVRTFGSKYVSKALDFEHDLHLDAPPRKVSRMDQNLKKESELLLKRLQKIRERRMKRNRHLRRMKYLNHHKEHQEDDDVHDDAHEDDRHDK